MKIWLAALLGALQGVTEFLPVSSSGHLAVFQRFFGLGEVDMFFDVLLHFATLIAIIVFYRYEILDMLREIGGFFGAWLGGLAMVNFGNYDWMWYADIVLASLAALVNVPIREAHPRLRG